LRIVDDCPTAYEIWADKADAVAIQQDVIPTKDDEHASTLMDQFQFAATITRSDVGGNEYLNHVRR
jgi:hypothetical protein